MQVVQVRWSFFRSTTSSLQSSGEETGSEEEAAPSAFIKPTNNDLREVIDCLVAIQGPCVVSLLGPSFVDVADEGLAATPPRCASPLTMSFDPPVHLLDNFSGVSSYSPCGANQATDI